MPSWWGKSSSKKAKKKTSKENSTSNLNRLVSPTEQRGGNVRVEGNWIHCDKISQKGSRSRAESLSISPSSNVSRCQSFADRPHAQPLPVPASQCDLMCAPSGVVASKSMREKRGKRCCVDSDDSDDCKIHSPVVNDVVSGGEWVSNGNPRDQTSVSAQKNSKEVLMSENVLSNDQFLVTPPKAGILSNCQSYAESLQNGAFASVPDSSMPSPSRSPCPGQILRAAPKSYPGANVIGPRQCSSPGSGQTSGHNSIGGDMPGHLLWQHSRGSPECSPIPSPRLASPGHWSRIHSSTVSSRHPRAGGPSPESTTSWHDEGKKSHQLPLPPSKGSCWKKGKLIGCGTFGHVFVGFNSDSGETCAMKEVTLFSDDA